MDKVEAYIAKKETWRKELELIRSVFKNLPLTETIKWGAPTYVFEGKNIVGIAAFKNYCGLWFFQGALLQDKYHKLYNAQEGKTTAMLQWRFYSIDEIDVKLIKEYTLEAIKNSKAALEIKPNSTPKKLSIPSELKAAFTADRTLASKFNRFADGYQREFANYIAEAKREATKKARLEKIKPMILSGISLNNQYKNK